MRTHTSYKVSKRLKEFMGKEAPEPMGDLWHISKSNPCLQKGGGGIPAREQL